MLGEHEGSERTIFVRTDADIVSARQAARSLATGLDFSDSDGVLIATAISEVARNMVEYAGGGEIALSLIVRGDRKGLLVVARDSGPGIVNLELALRDGYSTGGGLGLGLPGARRLMDEFAIESAPGKGTLITLIKWVG